MRRYAEMLAELQPESPVAMEALATLAFADGDYCTAARYCRNLAETVPDRFENWFNLGVAYHKMGNYQKAAQAYQQAAALQARFARRSHLNLGVAQQELSDLPAARASYEKALEIDPDQSGRLVESGAGAGAAGRAAVGRETLRHASPRTPRNGATPTSAWATCACCAPTTRTSAEAFQACLAQDAPTGPKRTSTPASPTPASGNADEAQRCFQEALMLRPDSSRRGARPGRPGARAGGFRRGLRTASPPDRTRREAVPSCSTTPA